MLGANGGTTRAGLLIYIAIQCLDSSLAPSQEGQAFTFTVSGSGTAPHPDRKSEGLTDTGECVK